MPLKNTQILSAAPGSHCDGDGLYLEVTRKGSKSWMFRYQMGGRRREMGLGSLVGLSAPQARAIAAQLRLKVANGIDPLAEREAERLAAEAAARAAEVETERQQQTFQKVAEAYIATHEAGWSNAKHIQQWTNTLKTYVYPKIGSKTVDAITTADVVAILKPIWAKKPETASRVRMRIEAVLNSAKALGWREGENPAVWKGGLDAVLPRRGKVKTVRHHPAMPHASAPAFMAALQAREGMGARALEFTILTAARSGEVRGARWDEIDLEKALWVIPATRMKAKREHRVALSSAAVALLRAMPRFANSLLIFPGSKGQALSDMSLSAVLKRMDLGHFTVHGFRSTFRDWAAEQGFAFDAIEAALAHKIGNSVVTAYLRTDHLEMRKGIMQAWADHLASHAA
ncbi:site-specific integrase [Novosphingobium sp. IK01]|uniref:Site-specific integrase n=2 Tax=Novosphingobium pituita TaxID=3056842 RepID=A0ABQ6PAN4_9SPHN|nr:site-specific integrase [Novosphingobium sp. IK01]